MDKKFDLKNRREELGLTLEQVADYVGVGKSTVRKWETGYIKNMKRDKLQALSEILKVSPGVFINTSESSNDTLGRIATPYRPDRRVPILGRVPAGQPLYAMEHIEGYTFVDFKDNEEYFGLIVRGDSMNAARIQDGDIVIVRRQSCVDNGDIAIVLVNGEDATIKRFYQNGSVITLSPQSLNPAHVAQMYDGRTDIFVLGKVVEVKFKP